MRPAAASTRRSRKRDGLPGVGRCGSNLPGWPPCIESLHQEWIACRSRHPVRGGSQPNEFLPGCVHDGVEIVRLKAWREGGHPDSECGSPIGNTMRTAIPPVPASACEVSGETVSRSIADRPGFPCFFDLKCSDLVTRHPLQGFGKVDVVHARIRSQECAQVRISERLQLRAGVPLPAHARHDFSPPETTSPSPPWDASRTRGFSAGSH